MHPLAQKVVERDERATARVCRLVDDRAGDYLQILKDLFPHTGRAWTLGVTGNPGSGKSTLTDRLVAAFRKQGKRVGVVAVDPTSPYTGGAILGDRIRMQAHFTDPDVFIRSLGTRGALGGLSRSATDVVRVLDAWGADVILVETVGVGQDELEVTRAAHTTLVVVAPGLGDDVQAIKAGIFECADVFCVNKADREGADGTARDLELMIALGRDVRRGQAGADRSAATRMHHGAHAVAPEEAEAGAEEVWTAKITRSVATRNEGTEALVAMLEAHRSWLESTPAGRRRKEARLRETMEAGLREALLDHALTELGPALEEATARVARLEVDPYAAAEELVRAFRSARVPG